MHFLIIGKISYNKGIDDRYASKVDDKMNNNNNRRSKHKEDKRNERKKQHKKANFKESEAKSRTERKNREKNRQQSNRRAKGKDSTEERKRSLFASPWMRIIGFLGALLVLGLIGYTIILYGGKVLIDEDKLQVSPPTTIETTDGEIIWYLYDEYRLPVELKQIPEHVQDAFIAIEDKRFYSHSGVDFRSIARAIYVDLVARDKVEGASTITQQLAKNLFLTNDKSWWRKIKEVMIALHLEREFSKEQIFEMYLNVIYFGQGQYGIEAAANKYFHKSVDELTIDEGALLAGIIKAPNGYSPINETEKALNRRNLVLETMAELNYISQEEMEGARQKKLQLNLSTRKVNPAYHTIADLVIKEAEQLYGLTLEQLQQNRYRIITSMDPDFQQIAYDWFQYDGYFPGNNPETVEGSFVMMDEADGSIVAALGGRKYERGNLNRVLKKRQPGSAIKPIAVYAPALETAQYDPYTLLPDRKEEWGDHKVRNYDDHYEGEVSLYEAIIKSKNTTATWLLNEIGIDFSKQYLQKLGIELEDEGLSIALGGLTEGMSPVQLVEAYRPFVHQGEKIAAHIILEIYNNNQQLVADADFTSEQVFSKQVAWNMTEMLQDVVTKGTGQSGYYPYALAGKTGTTEHTTVEGKARDAWFVGFTPEYVTALWMGYDRTDEEHYLTGGSQYPTQLTKKILSEVAERKEVVKAFTKPDDVEALADPVQLPEITDLVGTYTFGGFKILKGKLSWSGTKDLRTIYRIYERNGEEVNQIGEVKGDEQFIIDDFLLFKQRSYFIVPVDPLTGKEGERSNEVHLP